MPHQDWLDQATGERRPSVTEVTSLYYPEELACWRGRVGNSVADAILETAGQFGTKTHSLIEERFRRGEPLGADFETEPEAALADKAVEWAEARGVEIVGQELGLYSAKYRYGGTCDLLCRFRGEPAVVLVDWKTSGSIKKTYRMQLAAYAWLYNEHKRKNWKTGVNAGWIVRLDKRHGAKPPEAKLFPGLETDFQAFLGLLTVWDFLNDAGAWAGAA